MQIRIITVVLFLQSLIACQNNQGNLSLSEANIVTPSAASPALLPEKAQPAATNIIFQSADGGQTWQDVSEGLPKDVMPEGVFTSNGEVFLGTNSGLYRSSSASATPHWEPAIFLEGRITDVAPGRSGMLASSYGHGLFQNIAGTEVWSPVSKSLNDRLLRTVVETPAGALLVGSDMGIYKSADNGATWKQVFAGGLVLNLVVSGDVLIGGGLAGVVRSTDGGEHWENVLDENILIKNTGMVGNQLAAILGTHDPFKVCPDGITSRVRTSADGGKTWQRLEQAPLPVHGVFAMDERLADAKDVYDIVQTGELLFCSFDTGIFRSADHGKTWEPVMLTNGKGGFHLSVSGGVIYALQGAGGC